MNSQTPQIKWWYDLKDMAFGNACSGDIDFDGKMEIVFSCYRNDSCIYALNAEDGTLLWKFNTGGCNDAAPLIFDVNNDDTLEVLLTSSCVPRTFCLNGATGKVVWTAQSNGSDSPPTLGDVDKDGEYEMLFGEFGGTVRCLNASNGNLKWVFSVDSNSWIQTEPLLLDLNMDGDLDFVVANYNFDTSHSIYAFRAKDHNLLWKTSLPKDVMYHGASFADIDKDNKPEIAIGSYDGHLYMLNGEDGSLICDFSLPDSFYIGAPTSIADINNDNNYEIIFVDYNKISALSHNCQLVWSYIIPDYATSFRGAALSDINNDGILDVVFGSSKGKLIALSGESGNLIWELDLADHYNISFDIDHGPIISDFDNDGYLDVFIVGGYAEYPETQNNYGRAYLISTGSKGGPDWLMFRRDIIRSASIPINSTNIKKEKELTNKIIYSNFANDFITIEIDDKNLTNDLSFTIWDYLGNKFDCSALIQSNQIKIDISKLANGIYLLLSMNGSKILSRELFIKI